MSKIIILLLLSIFHFKSYAQNNKPKFTIKIFQEKSIGGQGFAKVFITFIIKNPSNNSYYTNDTGYIKKELDSGRFTDLSLFLYKKRGNAYKQIPVKMTGYVQKINDSCYEHCCTCHRIDPKRTFSFTYELSKIFVFKKGRYRVQSNWMPVLMSDYERRGDMPLFEYSSNVVYFYYR